MEIMVLNDGETFSGLDGCKILKVPDGLDVRVDLDEVESMVKSGELDVLEEFEGKRLRFALSQGSTDGKDWFFVIDTARPGLAVASGESPIRS